jgi:hypothetical protein
MLPDIDETGHIAHMLLGESTAFTVGVNIVDVVEADELALLVVGGRRRESEF